MEWRPIPGYEGFYEASSEGHIKRVGVSRGSVAGRILAGSNHAMGYKAISLNRQGIAKTFLVHRLVAAAFFGEIGEKLEVNHKNGDKQDNAITNLEIVTRPYNIQHGVDMGLIPIRGKNNPSAILDDPQVLEIVELHKQGWGYKRIAKEYQVTWEAVRNIIKGRTWKHLTGL